MNIEFQHDATALVEGQLYVLQRRRLERVGDLLKEMNALVREKKIRQDEKVYEIDALCAARKVNVMYHNIKHMPIDECISYNDYKFQKVSEHLYRVF